MYILYIIMTVRNMLSHLVTKCHCVDSFYLQSVVLGVIYWLVQVEEICWIEEHTLFKCTDPTGRRLSWYRGGNNSWTSDNFWPFSLFEKISLCLDILSLQKNKYNKKQWNLKECSHRNSKQSVNTCNYILTPQFHFKIWLVDFNMWLE